MSSEKVLTISNENFDAEVKNSDLPVLVDFWASWCGPCRMVAPIIDELADEFQGRAKVGKINVDDQRHLAARYGVMSIPTIMLFKNGEVVEKIVGARPKSDFVSMIERHL
ncbi:MAG: thioredoxin [Clostridiaceae bacterium]|nr:thioredoxin [Clostridiaceae bacterium]